MFLKAIKQFYQLHYFELIHAAKSTLAFLIGYGLVSLMSDPGLHQQWLMVSIAVVLGTHVAVGMQVRKGYFRFLATLAGCALGCIVLLLPARPFVVPIFLTLSAFIFMYVAVASEKYTQIGLLGMITFCMIALSPDPTFTVAINRTVETLGGILIAVLVSVFIFPLHTEKLFSIHLARNFNRLQKVYEDIFLIQKSRLYDQDIVDIERQIIKTNQTMLDLSNTPKYGFKKNAGKHDIISKILLYERALYRYWVVIEVAQRILIEHKNHSFLIHQAAFQLFVRDMIQYFKIAMNSPKADIDALLIALKSHQQSLYESIQAHHSDQEEAAALQTIVFITSRLCVVCEKLSSAIEKYQFKIAGLRDARS